VFARLSSADDKKEREREREREREKEEKETIDRGNRIRNLAVERRNKFTRAYRY
jgi:protein subunit release factor B